jgi:hypothetical protein
MKSKIKDRQHERKRNPAYASPAACLDDQWLESAPSQRSPLAVSSMTAVRRGRAPGATTKCLEKESQRRYG